MVMTVKEFIQGILLVLCMMATSVVLPIGLVVGSAPNAGKTIAVASPPAFIFEETR